MKQVTTASLSFKALDWAVALAMGLEVTTTRPFRYWKHNDYYGDDDFAIPKYSTMYGEGSPIIEKEHIATWWARDLWQAQYPNTEFHQYGTTMLEAGLRCYVESKLGVIVEVPDDLC